MDNQAAVTQLQVSLTVDAVEHTQDIPADLGVSSLSRVWLTVDLKVADKPEFKWEGYITPALPTDNESKLGATFVKRNLSYSILVHIASFAANPDNRRLLHIYDPYDLVASKALAKAVSDYLFPREERKPESGMDTRCDDEECCGNSDECDDCGEDECQDDDDYENQVGLHLDPGDIPF